MIKHKLDDLKVNLCRLFTKLQVKWLTKRKYGENNANAQERFNRMSGGGCTPTVIQGLTVVDKATKWSTNGGALGTADRWFE